MQFLLDGVNIGIVDTTAPYEITWDTTVASNAPHLLSAQARDAAGNIGTALAVAVIVSNATNPLVITNLTVASEKPYEVITNGLQVGALVYIDRGFTFTTIPPSLVGQTYLKTANDDKNSTGTNFLSFEVNQPVTVYVAHDHRITTKPTWLTSAFTDEGQDLVTTDVPLGLFSQTFPAGTVTLGGNRESVTTFSMYSVVVVPVGNTAPLANAGPDQTVPRNTLVTLEGGGSSDPDTDPLMFNWSITNQPAGSIATLTNPTSVNPTFTPDVNGAYTVQLIVNDGTEDSAPDSVVITAENIQPVADTGNDQTVSRNTLVPLDGSGSSDLNNDPLSYEWTIIMQPVGSTATLTNSTSVNPTFTPDVDGDYTMQLIVNDGLTNSAPDTITLTASNNPPVLNPIGNHTIPLGQVLTFTMTGIDPNNDPVAFTATPLPLPANMTVNGSTGAVTFAPDRTQVGDHVLTMMVSDGLLMDSETLTITVNQVGSPSGTTELTGRLLDTNDFVVNGTETPIVGATVSILNTGLTSTSDAQGNFILTGLPVGTQVFDIDSTTANLAPDGSPYAGFREKIVLIANVTNVVTRPFYLPRIDASSITPVVPGSPTTVTNATLGITMTVPADTAKNLDGSDYTGVLSISEVPAGLAPAALPNNLQPGLLITIQPPGVTFETPVPISFPNTDDLATGTGVDLWSLDPETGIFIIVGTGTVNGTSILINDGGIRAADWHAILPPAPNPGPPGSNMGPNPNLPNDPDDPVPPNPDNKPEDPCNKKTGSATEVCSGNLSVEHRLASYRSLGVSRVPKLLYRSLSADPQPMIFNNPTISQRSAVPLTMSAQLEVAGVEQDASVVTDTSGLSESTDELIRQVVQFDASMFTTGSYPYSLRLTNQFTRSAVGATVSDRVLVRNEQASAFGAGWTVNGLQRLFTQPDGSVVLANGSGETLRFGSPLEVSTLLEENFDTENGGFGRLNIFTLTQWNVATGSVDIIGNGFVNLLPTSQGLYLDLDGTTNAPIIILESKTTFTLIPGDYTFEFGLAGSQRGGTDTVTVEVDGVYSENFTFDTSDPYRIVARSFTVTTPITGKIRFTCIGGDNIGVLLDDVRLKVESQLGQYQEGTPILEHQFDLDTEGWQIVADGTGPTHIATGGNPGGYIQSTYLGTGETWYWQAPVTFLGDQSAAYSGFLSYDLKQSSTSAAFDNREILLTGAGITLTFDTMHPGTNWTHYAVLLHEGAGWINTTTGQSPSQAEMQAVLADITDLQIRGDFRNGGNTGGLDNVAWKQNAGLPILSNTFQSPLGDFSALKEEADGTFTRTMKDGTQILFDTLGRQTSMVDRNGNTTLYAYEGTSDRLLTIADPASLVTTAGTIDWTASPTLLGASRPLSMI